MKVVALILAVFVLAIVAVGQLIKGERWEVVSELPDGCLVVERQYVPPYPGSNKTPEIRVLCPETAPGGVR